MSTWLVSLVSEKNSLVLEARSMLLFEESRLSRKQGRDSAHDTPSSSTVLISSGSGANKGRTSKEFCRNFQRGFCRFGERYRFVHSRGNSSGPSPYLYSPYGNVDQPTTLPRASNATTLCYADNNDDNGWYKARLVANRKSQQVGIDCDETFSLVVKPATTRTVFSLAVSCQWPIHQLEMKNAFLYGEISETVYMHQPPDFTDPAHPDYLCLYMHDPRKRHLHDMKRVLRYLRGTIDLGLQLFTSSISQVTAYSDADWACCPATRRSTSGYCVFLGDNLLSWSSKRQETSSRSSAEAEYRGVANAIVETSWVRNLLQELHTPISTATLVYCDNVNVVYLSANPVQHQRTKHIEIDIHFV
nr:ribonuclease H-like domain-containing protein [Tanacetum cinerariifolium]GEZ18065.1 ribonuclease H-like domain-containing protein [Tanacetum cinerariifolium]GEZ18068.1 ribonuclease H-like domain-containing protein [Tanacetum cinerariifolium]